MVDRVVVEHIDDSRLDGLLRIGMDEVSYKCGHRYVTIVADHDSGRVVWVGGAHQVVLRSVLRRSRPDPRCAGGGDQSGRVQRVPAGSPRPDPAGHCLLKWTNEVLDSVHRAEAPRIPLAPGLPNRREWRRARYALRAGWERLDSQHKEIVNALRRHRYKLWRTWELKERLRELYRSVHPDDAEAYLKAWCTSALRSRINAFTNLVRRIRKHFDAIIAAAWASATSTHSPR